MNEEIKIYTVELYDLYINDSDLMEYAKNMPETSIEESCKLTIYGSEHSEYPNWHKERRYKLICPWNSKSFKFQGTLDRHEIHSESGVQCDFKKEIYVVKKDQNFYELGTGIPVQIINFEKDIDDPLEGCRWTGCYHFSSANTFGIIKSTCCLTHKSDLDYIDDYLNWVEENKTEVSRVCNKANPNVSVLTSPYAKLKKMYAELDKMKLEREAHEKSEVSSKQQRILSYVNKIK